VRARTEGRCRWLIGEGLRGTSWMLGEDKVPLDSVGGTLAARADGGGDLGRTREVVARPGCSEAWRQR
jgi:hypothetical protein